MMRYNDPLHLSSPAAGTLPADRVRLAALAYLARFTGSSREHTQSDLRCYLRWCADRDLDPLAARRPDLEQYIRWMQETCRFKPSTISRRFSVAAGFYRTCVIDDVLEHSPAEHVRRPNVPAESPTLGFTHLQFEALLTAARESANHYDFALVAMLGLLGLRIFEATGTDIADLAEMKGLLPEPTRVGTLDYDNATPRQVGRELLRIRSMWFGVLSITISQLLLTALQFWAVEYYKRYFHMGGAEAGAVTSLLGIGAVFGILGGGFLSDRYLKKGYLNARVYVVAISSIAATAVLLPAFLSTTLPVAVPFFFMGGVFLTLPVAPIVPL